MFEEEKKKCNCKEDDGDGDGDGVVFKGWIEMFALTSARAGSYNLLSGEGKAHYCCYCCCCTDQHAPHCLQGVPWLNMSTKGHL